MTVVECRGLSAAAQMLYLGQPSVSHQVRQLEQVLRATAGAPTAGPPGRRRRSSITLDEHLWGGESLLRDGAPVGHGTSAAHSPTLGRTVGLAFVSGAGLEKVEVQVAGERYPAQISRKAPCDPTSARVKV
ncbi:glycine cleavage T C-terminal barrel domain-containing protein [Nonomuraea dietziae]|uniref:glycine cleavage T C-terminal barrel domain-containing protein n=1 Tax=Nonomuraea dietziae TaxID=65515 RepID=UPI00341B026D